MKTIGFLSMLFLLASCQVNSQSITDNALAEKRAQLSAAQLADLEEAMAEVKALSLGELKEKTEESFSTFQSSYTQLQQYLADERNAHKKNYAPEEEEYDCRKFDPLKNNDTAYIAYVQSGLRFRQTFEKDTSYIGIVTENGEFLIYDFSSRESATPRHFLDHESYEDVSIKKLIYADGEVLENVASEDCNIPNGFCLIGKTKLLDAVQLHYTIRYISGADSILLAKEDIGKMQKGYRLVDIRDNYVVIEGPSDPLMKIEAYNKQGSILQLKYGTSHNWCTDSEQKEKDFIYNFYKKNYEGVRHSSSKEEALSIIESYSIDQLLGCGEYNSHHYFFEGNLSHVKLYLETKRDTLEADATFVRGTPDYPYYLHEFDEETRLIDKNGNVLYKLPIGELEFVSSPSGNINTSFLTNDAGNDTEYYHVDVKSKKYSQLKDIYSITALSDKAVLVRHNEEPGLAVFNSDNRNISGYRYNEVNDNNGVLVARKLDDTYRILSPEGLEIGEDQLYYVDDFQYGLAKVIKQEKVGFINTKGELHIPLQYDINPAVYAWSEEASFEQMQIVKKGDYYGVIDLKNGGKLVIPVEYAEVIPVTESNEILYVLKKEYEDRYYGVVDMAGKVRVPFQHSLPEIQNILYAEQHPEE